MVICESIADFKIRGEAPVGLLVTLRRHEMYDFLYKLINLLLPKICDFSEISEEHFDGWNN